MAESRQSAEGPYARAHEAYVRAGWLAPIPTGNRAQRRAKAPVPKGYTGRSAKTPTHVQRESWANTHGVNNVALHMGAEQLVIGIDVDAYDKADSKGEVVEKSGDETLAELEARWGKLPPTVRSSARGFDNPSGIRFYRLPDYAAVVEGDRTFAPDLVTKFPGVEIIQAKHRYAVVWPSMHPDENVGRYEWYDPSGRKLGRPPRFNRLPELPALWVEGLLAGNGSSGPTGEQAELSDDDARLWMAEHGSGSSCRAVRGVLRKERAALEAAAESGTSRYDTCVEGVWALVQLAAEGHRGVGEAVKRFGRTYRDLVRDEPNRDTSEWSRMVVGAVNKAVPLTLDENGESVWEQHADAECPERDPRSWPGPNSPLDVARRYVAEFWTEDGEVGRGGRGDVTLKRWRDQFYRWAGTHYEPISDEAVMAHLGGVLADVEYVGAGSSAQILRWNPTPVKLRSVLGMLVSVSINGQRVYVDDDVEPEDTTGDTVALANGLLDLETRTLKPHTPRRFALSSLAFDYRPDARCPAWTKFLDSIWPDDEERANVETLAEQFGYLLTGASDLQKIILWIGVPRSGKGTAAYVLTQLMGHRNVAAPTLSRMAGTFGLQQLIGRSLAIVGDAETTAKAGAGVLDDLKAISGGDAMTVHRKNKSDWIGHLTTRFLLQANSSPSFIDPSGAITRRLVPLHFRTSFAGREDTELREKLSDSEELAGVLNWALEGYERLRDNGGRFTLSTTTKQVTEQLGNEYSPIRSFLKERCEVELHPERNEFSPRNDVYDAYAEWCHENDAYQLSRMAFGKDLRSVLPRAIGDNKQRKVDGEVMRVYYGVWVRDEDEAR